MKLTLRLGADEVALSGLGGEPVQPWRGLTVGAAEQIRALDGRAAEARPSSRTPASSR